MAEGLLRAVESYLSDWYIGLVFWIICLGINLFFRQVLTLYFLSFFKFLGIRVDFDLARL